MKNTTNEIPRVTLALEGYVPAGEIASFDRYELRGFARLSSFYPVDRNVAQRVYLCRDCETIVAASKLANHNHE